MALIQITMLGSFNVTTASQAAVRLPTAKARALFAYLISEGSRPQQRRLLVELLWPGLARSRARTNLRQVLYQLRQALAAVGAGELLRCDSQTIAIDTSSRIACDARQFEQQLAAVDAHDHAELAGCRDCVQRLEDAVALYRGPFLDDLAVRNGERFDRWRRNRQDVLQQKQLDALARLTQIELRNGHLVRAERRARRQIAIDRLSERAGRQLIEALARQGLREQALGHYRTLRALLLQELAMQPSAVTERLTEAIAADRLDRLLPPGELDAGYELLDLIGASGSGRVYRARQASTGRVAAVKIFEPQRGQKAFAAATRLQRLRQLAAIEHPHIVPVYDCWQTNTRVYLAMRYFAHGSLQTALAQGRDWPLADVDLLVTQIAAALASAHRQGLVHGRLKPSNVWRDGGGNSYLGDFESAPAPVGSRPLADALAHAAPEQLDGAAATPQADVYALGCIAFELLTGVRPFGEAGIATRIQRKLSGPLPDARQWRPELPAALDQVLATATAVLPRQRFANATDFSRRLRAALAEES